MKNFINYLLFLLLFGSLTYGLTVLKSWEDHKNNMEKCAIAILADPLERLRTEYDFYGNPLVLDYKTYREYNEATVISVGKDGRLGTVDDYIIVKRDYNKPNFLVPKIIKDVLENVDD